jgi:hypothetical protein
VRIYYDTEFLEDGRTIELISIGMVADDGRELYQVNRDMPVRRIRKNAWLMENVVPHLPHGHGDWKLQMPKRWLFDYADPIVLSLKRIAGGVRRFIEATSEPELWADYGAYDHVALAQLFGRMVDLPAGIPMWTNDLRQEIHRHGLTDWELPLQKDGLHNALADARHAKTIGDHLTHLERPEADRA